MDLMIHIYFRIHLLDVINSSKSTFYTQQKHLNNTDCSGNQNKNRYNKSNTCFEQEMGQ